MSTEALNPTHLKAIYQLSEPTSSFQQYWIYWVAATTTTITLVCPLSHELE